MDRFRTILKLIPEIKSAVWKQQIPYSLFGEKKPSDTIKFL